MVSKHNLQSLIQEVKCFQFSHYAIQPGKSSPRAKLGTVMFMGEGVFKLIKRAINRPCYLKTTYF